MRAVRRLRLGVILATAGFASVASAGCGGGVKDPVYVQVNLATERFRLANGLDVVMHRDLAFQSVVVNVRYDSGSKDDPEGVSGLAHLVEHLTFKRKIGEHPEMFALLDEAGASDHNGGTTPDWTDYYEVVPESQLPLALWLEARRMARPIENVTPEDFATERSVVQNERRQHYENVPYGNMREALHAALFPADHPYHVTTIGTGAALDHATLGHARAFASRHYVPSNATLVIAGRFDPATARSLVTQYFGSIPASPAPPTRTIALPRLKSSKDVVLEVGVDAPAVEVGWLAPPVGTPGWYELTLFARAFERQLRNRLGDDARRCDVGVDHGNLASVFVVRVELTKKASSGVVTSAVDRSLRDFEGDGLGRLGDEKSSFVASRTLGLSSLGRRARELQGLVSRYDDPNSLQKELHAFSEITNDVLKTAMQRYLIQAERVVVVAKPSAQAPRAGKVKS